MGGVIALHLKGIIERNEKRKELGLPPDCKLLVSVGELSIRKNHKVVVEALNDLDNPSIYYMIVGIGQLKEDLIKLEIGRASCRERV